MIKQYFHIAGMIVLLVACWGLIAPQMVSAKDTIVCILGFVVVIAAPAVVAAWFRSVFGGNKDAGKLQS